MKGWWVKEMLEGEGKEVLKGGKGRGGVRGRVLGVISC